jgi:glycosyltransferase involved in cell wall biosynthesis
MSVELKIPENLKVSVLIPRFNDALRLDSCVAALERQTYPSDKYEVIVIVNASIEDIGEVMSRFPHAHYLLEVKKGSYAAHNAGLKVVTGEIVVFKDSDCIPESDWIENGVSALCQDPNNGLVAGAINFYYKHPDRLTGIELHESLTAFPQKMYIEENHFGATSNVFTFRTVLDAVRPSDADLQSGGDIEWGRRVYAKEYKLYYTSDARGSHPARATYAEMYKK